MRMFAKEIGLNGENSLIIPLWNDTKRIQTSAHPLADAQLGNDSNKGVVNSMGQVFKEKDSNEVYDGLYIVDASIIPSPLGVNPSLTISALAFRLAKKIAGDKKDRPQ